VQREQAVPTSVELLWPDLSGGPGSVVVVLEGTSGGVAARAARVQAALPGAVLAPQSPAGAGSRPWAAGGTGLAVACTVPGVAAALSTLRAGGHRADARGSAGSGIVEVGLPDLGVDELTGVLRALRAAVRPYDGSVVVRQAAPQVKAEVDVWGPVPALELMRRVKQRFDPAGTLSPGRFVGGL
jgi:glycolate oxidase FAD binding subunit